MTHIWVRCNGCGFKQYEQFTSASMEGDCPKCGGYNLNLKVSRDPTPPEWWDQPVTAKGSTSGGSV